MGSLLIAGPLALDDHPQQPDCLGGVGGYAAIAAAPLVTHVQLWCRAGSDITPQLQGLLREHHIDLAGVDWTGPTPRSGKDGFQPGGPLLPEAEPTDAERLGGVLLIGLPPAEWRRAARVVAALPLAETRPVVASPRPSDLLDATFRKEVCAGAEVLVLSVAQAQRITGAATALEAARSLQADGAKSVVLTAGQLGGLLAYRAKATTYPALPVDSLDKAGVSAAFPGALAAWIAGSDKADFATVKRGCAVASAVGSICAQGIGPKKLLAASRQEILDRFNRLRRDHKF